MQKPHKATKQLVAAAKNKLRTPLMATHPDLQLRRLLLLTDPETLVLPRGESLTIPTKTERSFLEAMEHREIQMIQEETKAMTTAMTLLAAVARKLDVRRTR